MFLSFAGTKGSNGGWRWGHQIRKNPDIVQSSRLTERSKLFGRREKQAQVAMCLLSCYSPVINRRIADPSVLGSTTTCVIVRSEESASWGSPSLILRP